MLLDIEVIELAAHTQQVLEFVAFFPVLRLADHEAHGNRLTDTLARHLAQHRGDRLGIEHGLRHCRRTVDRQHAVGEPSVRLTDERALVGCESVFV